MDNYWILHANAGGAQQRRGARGRSRKMLPNPSTFRGAVSRPTRAIRSTFYDMGQPSVSKRIHCTAKAPCAGFRPRAGFAHDGARTDPRATTPARRLNYRYSRKHALDMRMLAYAVGFGEARKG